MKERQEIEQELEKDALPHPITIPIDAAARQAATGPISPRPNIDPVASTAQQPTAENIVYLPTATPVLSSRSVSCNNMGLESAPAPTFMKQRDPSTSSLLRKRMSEERGLSTLDKRMSQSTTSQEHFITQKDPTQSTILRNKSLNRSGSQSLSRQESLGRYSSEPNGQQMAFRSERIPNERTFYHDSRMHLESAGIDIAANVEIASPLSMQSGGNRRFILASTENLPQSPVNQQPCDVDMHVIAVEPVNQRPNQSYPNNQNVCDEEKVQALLSQAKKPNKETAAIDAKEKAKDTTEMGKTISSVMPGLAFLQLMNVEEMHAVDTTAQAKPMVQYLAKFDSTLHPKEAETSEYSNSKLFDNYCASVDRLHAPSTNVSTQDLHLNQAKQRDPSQSPFTRNRYRASQTPSRIEVRPSEENLLEHLLITSPPTATPAIANFAGHQSTEQVNHSQTIRQKDPNKSTVLNRRRRNLSQIIVGADAKLAHAYDAPVKVTASMSFDKSLTRAESERYMNYDAGDVRITKGVSFEMDRIFSGQGNGDEFGLDKQGLTVTQMPNR